MKRICKISIVSSLLITVIFILEISLYSIKGLEVEKREITINHDNCEYQIDENNHQITIESYQGTTADVIVVPEEIKGHPITNISADLFDSCSNLETIKIPKKVAQQIGEIKHFVVKEDSQDSEYVEYITTKQYNEEYLEYISLSKEEQEKVEVIPSKFYQPLLEAEDETEPEATTIPSKFDLRDKVYIEVENQNPYGICYAYATLSSLETNLALQHNEYVDLSEIYTAIMSGQGRGGWFDEALTVKPVLESACPKNDLDTKSDAKTEKLKKAISEGATASDFSAA